MHRSLLNSEAYEENLKRSDKQSYLIQTRTYWMWTSHSNLQPAEDPALCRKSDHFWTQQGPHQYSTTTTWGNTIHLPSTQKIWHKNLFHHSIVPPTHNIVKHLNLLGFDQMLCFCIYLHSVECKEKACSKDLSILEFLCYTTSTSIIQDCAILYNWRLQLYKIAILQSICIILSLYTCCW